MNPVPERSGSNYGICPIYYQLKQPKPRQTADMSAEMKSL